MGPQYSALFLPILPFSSQPQYYLAYVTTKCYLLQSKYLISFIGLIQTSSIITIILSFFLCPLSPYFCGVIIKLWPYIHFRIMSIVHPTTSLSAPISHWRTPSLLQGTPIAAHRCNRCFKEQVPGSSSGALQ